MDTLELKKLRHISLLVLGITIIIAVIYYRFIVKRLPRELTFMVLKEDQYIPNIPIILFTGIFWILSISVIYICLRVLLKKPFTFRDNIIIQMVAKIADIVKESLITVYGSLVNKIPNGFEVMGQVLLKFHASKLSNYRVIVLTEYFLRLIICFCFLIDIFIFYRFCYFYKSLLIIVLVLCLKLWMFNIKDWSSNLETAKSYLNIKDRNGERSVTFKDEFKDQDLDIIYHYNQYCNLKLISDYIKDFDAYKTYYDLRFNLIYYTCIFCGCTYIIYLNLTQNIYLFNP